MGNDANDRSKRSGSASRSADTTGKRRFGSAPRAGTSTRLSDASELGTIIDAVIGQGDALMFSRTSDGGAIVVTLLRDKSREKQYLANDHERDDVITWLKEEYLGG